MNTRWKLIVPMCLVVLLAAALPAVAANVVVGTCMSSKVSFGSIGEAVQGVPAGSTIQVCPGAYAEQVVINKSLTLKGITAGNAAYPVIKAPASGLAGNALGLTGSPFWAAGGPLAAQILIEGGADVTLTNIALDAAGANVAACAQVVGVLVQDASATLNTVSVKNQLNPCTASYGIGAGVLAQSDTSSPTTITVKHSSLVNTGQAFEADGANITSTVTDNSFVSGPTSNFNAVSIVNGNSTIQNNSITDFNYPPAGTDLNSVAYGIYFYCVPGGAAVNNVITNTQVGIYELNGCTTTAVSATNNTITNAQLIGIDAGGTNGLVQGNDIRNSLTAIRFPAGASNTVQNNTINDACTAFGSNPATGTNTLVGNTVVNGQSVSIVNTTGLCP